MTNIETTLKAQGVTDKGMKVAVVIFNFLVLKKSLSEQMAFGIVGTMFKNQDVAKINAYFTAATNDNPYVGKNI
jgi:TRAP-type uncharacterized transport system substrate-binding protein